LFGISWDFVVEATPDKVPNAIHHLMNALMDDQTLP
jgi:hypothetical protein